MAARVMDAASDRLFRRAVRRGKYDWILATSPQFDAAFLTGNPSARVVMVVHDLMSCVTAPDGLYDAAGPGLSALLYLATRATLIVCISRDTRNALLRHNLVDPERAVVIPTGNLLASSNVAPAQLDLQSRYLLFVGERSGRKGFFSLIPALQPLFAEQRDLQLLCTGQFRAAELDYLQRLGMADRVHAIPADDATLVALYRNAICLLYPSLYEGFGLPVVEAMHLGCPVITTRCGALADIAGDAAIFVNPFEQQQIEAAVRSLLDDPAQRRTLVELGHRQAAQFETTVMMRSFQQALQVSLPPPQ